MPLGPSNDAGKTSTFIMVVGLLKPNAGRVLIDDSFIDYRQYEDIRTLSSIVSHFG